MTRTTGALARINEPDETSEFAIFHDKAACIVLAAAVAGFAGDLTDFLIAFIRRMARKTAHILLL